MGVAEQAEITLACVPDLSEEQRTRVIDLWAQKEYDDSWHGHQRAQADLLALARWESLSDEQRDSEIQRQRKG